MLGFVTSAGNISRAAIEKAPAVLVPFLKVTSQMKECEMLPGEVVDHLIV